MARELRTVVPGAWYHVVARGIDKRRIFHNDRDYERLELLLGTLPERFGLRIHSYVMMTNHYHLQIETPRENLSEALRWLNVSYAIWYNRKRGRVGPLFQGRFKAVVHDAMESGITIHEYIHLNPVRLKRFGTGRGESEGPDAEQIKEMGIELKAYRWSSYLAYAGLASKPDWLEIKKILEVVPGRSAQQKQNNYRKRFAQLIRTKDLGTTWKDGVRGGIVLGSERFLNEVRRLMEGDRNEQRGLREVGQRAVSWAKIIEAVEQEWEEPWEAIKHRHGDAAREVAMVIARRFGGLSLREIGEAVGEMKYPAVSDAIRRTNARLERGERPLSQKLKAILKNLNL